jgi:hypothetical protein
MWTEEDTLDGRQRVAEALIPMLVNAIKELKAEIELLKKQIMLNTYVVEGGVGKCTAFSALIPKLKEKSEVQIYTPYIGCFASNPDVKLVLEQTLPLQDARIMASDNIFYCEPYKSNFQFGKQHIIESYCEHHGVEYDKIMTPKLYTDTS